VNSLNAMRLGLAFAVLVSHGFKFAGSEHDPLGSLIGEAPRLGVVDLGTLAVDGFFILSGFLITRSFLSARSWQRFIWHRFVRILPAFWVCLIIGATVFAPLGAWLDSGDEFSWTGRNSATSYIFNNAGLLMRQYSIGNVLDGVVNGSLYTLFFEFLCYIGLAILGVLGILSRRPVVVLGLAVVCGLTGLIDAMTHGQVTGGGDHPAREHLLRFTTMFLVGSACQRYAQRVPTGVSAICMGMLIIGASFMWLDSYLLLAPVGLSLVLLPLGASRRLAQIGRRRDLSYGFYLYAWPVQAVLAAAGATGAGLVPYMAVATLVALGLAWSSWHLVEAPALATKSWTPALVRSVARPRS
jgi:peptidoglycan/LPS O-acetylase OafA/YrhL